ncbi:MAG: YeiH family protein [Opitutales bacterium]
MQFEYQALCDTPLTLRRQVFARWLLLGGALAALVPGVPPWAALLAGAAIALGLGNPCAAATGRVAKVLLQVAVVGLGAGVNLAVVGRVGRQGLGYTLLGLGLTFALGVWLAGRLKVAPKLAALICAGTGICGGSAIAAAAPAINAAAGETSAALATVFLLNAVALVIFPPLGTLAGLSPHQFGLWCALAIHDTSSVTGAALTHGPEALAVATTVKLARALWIVPVALMLGWWFRRREGGGPAAALRVPWFIAGFVGLSALFTFGPELARFTGGVTIVAHGLLTLTLFFIGAGLSRTVVRAAGARPFLHGVILWLVIGSATLAAIKTGWIH